MNHHSETNLARRVHQERVRRDLSQETLAKLMTDAGVKMHQSSIAKIERTSPPRRPITVDEALGFSRVFSIPLCDLLVSPEAADNDRIKWLEMQLAKAEERAMTESMQADALRAEIKQLTDGA